MSPLESTEPVLPPDETPSWLARNRKSAILLGIVLLLLAILGITTALQRMRNGTIAETNAPPVTPGVDDSTSSTATISDPTARPTFQRLTAAVRNDQDGDGLTDEEERQANTDPKLADSDADGLTDAEEVKQYQTNPRQKDTDSDGRSDGDEVRTGDNPKGTGQLRDLKQSIQQLHP